MFFLNSFFDNESARCKKCSWQLVSAWILLIFAMSAIPNFSTTYADLESWQGILYFSSRKMAHISEYFVLAALLWRAIVLHKNRPFLLTFFVTLILAALDEYHQTFVFGRTGNIMDIFIDMIGGSIAIFILNARAAKRVKINLLND